jgi:hypothetical protein
MKTKVVHASLEMHYPLGIHRLMPERMNPVIEMQAKQAILSGLLGTLDKDLRNYCNKYSIELNSYEFIREIKEIFDDYKESLIDKIQITWTEEDVHE